MKPGLFLKRMFLFIFIAPAICCNKSSSSGHVAGSPLQYKWTLVSRTATFPASARNNFAEKDSPGDYFSFGTNDTAYSYVTAYLPFSIDTAYYKASADSIIFYVNEKQNGFIFQSQDTIGNIHDTTVAQILELTDSSLVLSFPTIGTVTNLARPGITTYYPGTEIDSLKR
jgi:hypothetical protein